MSRIRGCRIVLETVRNSFTTAGWVRSDSGWSWIIWIAEIGRFWNRSFGRVFLSLCNVYLSLSFPKSLTKPQGETLGKNDLFQWQKTQLYWNNLNRSCDLAWLGGGTTDVRNACTCHFFAICLTVFLFEFQPRTLTRHPILRKGAFSFIEARDRDLSKAAQQGIFSPTNTKKIRKLSFKNKKTF